MLHNKENSFTIKPRADNPTLNCYICGKYLESGKLIMILHCEKRVHKTCMINFLQIQIINS